MGTRLLNEVVFFHRATSTLIFTDLVFNIAAKDASKARVFNWISGAAGHFGPHRLVRAMRGLIRPESQLSHSRVQSWATRRRFDRMRPSRNAVEVPIPPHTKARFFEPIVLRKITGVT